MRSVIRFGAAALAAGALLTTVAIVPAAAKKKAKPAACTGSFLPDGGPLTLGSATVDTIVLDRFGVMLSKDCGFATVHPKRMKKAWKLSAHWKQCGGLHGVRVTATVMLACDRMNLRVAGRPRAKMRFDARSCSVGGADGGSTWEAIQKQIIAGHGCTNDACHGAARSGGLDLRPGVAYQNLVDVPASTGTMKRIEPGDQSRSVFWLKLATASQGKDYGVGAGMPLAGASPLSAAELQSVLLWIRAGADQTGVIAGTAAGLNACLPPADPPTIRAATVPPPDQGVQLYAPPWPVPENGENEICYPTYYDFSNTIPQDQQAPCDPSEPDGPKCFFYKTSELTQTPNSHHSIIHAYSGTAAWNDPAWGEWTCLGGSNAGQKCDPTQPRATQCPGGGCAGSIVKAFACIGYGPEDFRRTGLATSIGGSQQPLERIDYPGGVYSSLPVKGMIVWNSHAFNLTSQPATNQEWLNLYFAGPTERKYPMLPVFDDNDIFIQNVPPFQKREYCRTAAPFGFYVPKYEFPQGANLFRLSSHTHKRGVLFRAWGPGIDVPCDSRCQGTNTSAACAFYCPGGVCPACVPEPTTPILTTTTYNDPDVKRYDPPLVLSDPDPAKRRFKFCGVFDNGFADPTTVKRRSLAPPNSAALCGNDVIACVNAPNQGKLCHGNNSECDSAPGKGDGVCDACPLRGAETTDDEMFILLGNWFMPSPGSPSAAFVDGPR